MVAPKRLLHRGDIVVFEGDSLTNRRTGKSLDTWPYLELMNWHESWASHISRWLWSVRPDLRLAFHNAAIGGSNCREMNDRYQATVAPHKPKWVCFTLGTNDAVIGVKPAEMKKAIETYAGQLREDSGGRLCYVMVGQRVADVPARSKDLQRRRTLLWRTIAKVVEAEGGIVVDCVGPMAKKLKELQRQWEGHTIYSDGLHLNAVGNAIVANEVLQALHMGGC